MAYEKLRDLAFKLPDRLYNELEFPSIRESRLSQDRAVFFSYLFLNLSKLESFPELPRMTSSFLLGIFLFRFFSIGMKDMTAMWELAKWEFSKKPTKGDTSDSN